MNEMFTNYPDVVTPNDVMKMLHIGRNNVYELLKNGNIKTLKIGKNI